MVGIDRERDQHKRLLVSRGLPLALYAFARSAPVFRRFHGPRYTGIYNQIRDCRLRQTRRP